MEYALYEGDNFVMIGTIEMGTNDKYNNYE